MIFPLYTAMIRDEVGLERSRPGRSRRLSKPELPRSSSAEHWRREPAGGAAGFLSRLPTAVRSESVVSRGEGSIAPADGSWSASGIKGRVCCACLAGTVVWRAGERFNFLFKGAASKIYFIWKNIFIFSFGFCSSISPSNFITHSCL